MRNLLVAAIAATALAPCAASATILTFDVSGGVSDFANMPQNYGDNVTGSPLAGHAYGVGAEGYTPNVTVSYGTPGEDPALWTTGYGDLTNIYFNDADGDTTFTTTFTADSGYLVDLYGFDMGWYFNSGATIQGVTIRDVTSNTVLFSEGSFFLNGGSTHKSYAFDTPLSAGALELVVNLTGLGGVSDDVGLDNIRFGQTRAPAGAVPEPATWALLIGGFFSAGAMLRSRRSVRA
jgi:hypothetical protein